MKSTINLMLVISSSLLREGIHKILEPEKDIEVIAEALTNLEIIPLIEQKKPDVLFIDTALPNVDVGKILESIKEKSAETKVILLLYASDEEVIIGAISSGVHGYLKNTSNPAQFIQAIRAVVKDEIWTERKILTKVLTRFLRLRTDNLRILKSKLTKREHEIVKLVVEGYSNEQISKKLYISENTVKNHLANIFIKLGVSKRLQLIFNLYTDNISKLINLIITCSLLQGYLIEVM
jgi:DNA-binding NarL/FixJ family response regulator